MAVKDDAQWEEPQEEFAILDIPVEYRTLVTEEKELTVRDLWSRFMSNELILAPDFQRHYVWDGNRASRFIESLLLGLPVPPLFLAENPQSTLDVIDGHQRLETLFRFMQPLLAGPSGDQRRRVRAAFSPALTLAGCEVLSELNGRNVTALSLDDRARLWDRKQNVVLVKKDSNPDMKFKLFERLNLGAMALNQQELRNCLYRGPYNNLIARLAEDPKVLEMFGRRQPDRRMGDRERVLRFFALAHRRERYRTPFRTFLNDEMAAGQHASASELSPYEAEFRQALVWTSRIFPGVMFQLFRVGSTDNPNGLWGRRRLDLLYETEMVGFHQFRERLEGMWSGLGDQTQRDYFSVGLRHRLVSIMIRDDFLSTLSEQTTAPRMMRQRFDLWLGALQDAVVNPPRIIDTAAKIVSLQRQSTACAVCPGHITSIEDTVIANISGKESLAHRFCSQKALIAPA